MIKVKEAAFVVVVGADVQKRTHTFVAVEGMSTPEALRCLERHLARIVFNHLTTDHAASATGLAAVA
ncbi:hypothetical protein [Nocardioides albidus]|uniref:hypothetical protein n=1 Tax=Nocardioides albidus TaxID=1517589 RepID=UPI00196006F1|nr:hypothetical protein [Nocardioides albidus]